MIKRRFYWQACIVCLVYLLILFFAFFGKKSIPFGIFMMICLGYFAFFGFLSIHTISITNHFISIKPIFRKKRVLRSDNIKSIDLYKKIDSSTISPQITLIDEEKVEIDNDAHLKRGLYLYFRDKITEPSVKPPLQSTESIPWAEQFKGHLYTSFNFIMLVILAGLVTAMTMSSYRPRALSSFIALLPFYFTSGLGTYYFEISNQIIVIRNHFFPWIRKHYPVSDIAVVNFEKGWTQSDGLRISTKDFKSALYRAGSLREKDWTLVKDKIQSLGIPFIN